MSDKSHWAQAIREQDEKLRVLHDARMRAHDEMRQAIAVHEFQSRAYDSASTKRNEYSGMLKMAVEREAYEEIVALEDPSNG